MPFEKGKSGNPKTQFKKGKSGNPKGRPKLPDLKDLIAGVLMEEKNGSIAAEDILKAMRKEAAKGDVKAATFLFDRGFGKPIQTVEAKVQTTKVRIGYGKQAD
jgi:hypothetical protein